MDAPLTRSMSVLNWPVTCWPTNWPSESLRQVPPSSGGLAPAHPLTVNRRGRVKRIRRSTRNAAKSRLAGNFCNFRQCPGHLQLAVLGGEGEAAFDEVERVSAKLLKPPATEDVEPIAHPRGEQFQFVGAGD